MGCSPCTSTSMVAFRRDLSRNLCSVMRYCQLDSPSLFFLNIYFQCVIGSLTLHLFQCRISQLVRQLGSYLLVSYLVSRYIIITKLETCVKTLQYPRKYIREHKLTNLSCPVVIHQISFASYFITRSRIWETDVDFLLSLQFSIHIPPPSCGHISARLMILQHAMAAMLAKWSTRTPPMLQGSPVTNMKVTLHSSDFSTDTSHFPGAQPVRIFLLVILINLLREQPLQNFCVSSQLITLVTTISPIIIKFVIHLFEYSIV